MKLWLIDDGLAENRATGDWYSRDPAGTWERLPDDVANRLAFNRAIDAMPGPMGDYLRAVRGVAVMFLFVRHGADLIEKTSAPMARALRFAIGDEPGDE